MEARCRPRGWRQLPLGPVHAGRLRLLGPVRDEPHISRSRFCRGLLLIVADIERAHNELASRGIEVSDVYHCAERTACRFHDADGVFQRVSGPAPDRPSYSSFVSFRDPDGNAWVLQEVTNRLPRRIAPGAPTYASATDLEAALIRAALAHGQHEKRIGKADPDWPAWYSEYMVAEQAGAELPT